MLGIIAGIYGFKLKYFYGSPKEDSSALFLADPKSNRVVGIKVAHEASSIRRSLQSSIFILTLTCKKTQSKLLNPP